MSYVLIVIGAVLLIWYIAPIFAHIFNIANGLGIVASIAIILIGAFIDSIPRNALFLLIVLATVVVFYMIAIFVEMKKFANYKSSKKPDTVVILGCRVKGTKPSKFLYKRCKCAAEYLNEKETAIAILSGGQGKDEEISEAECMKNVLVEMGIDESRLILEDKSTSTKENLLNSYEIIKENNLDNNVLFVTNEFHEYRTFVILRKEKMDMVFNASSCTTAFYTFLTYFTREVMALTKLLFGK